MKIEQEYVKEDNLSVTSMSELISELNSRGADLVRVVDVSMLSEKENRGYSVAILIGMLLSPDYIADHSHFGEKEHRAEELAEWTADFITAKRYKAFAQSEKNLIHGFYEEATKTTPLPHKKIAILAGMGWIGKNNLLVTQEYGSALCLCTVLTNAPLAAENRPIVMPKCGTCILCKDICPTGAIHGSLWEPGINRDLIVDVYHCDCCLKCLVNCPWTQRYMKNN